jgi:hypothetical protein
MADFSALTPGSSPVYLLAGIDDAELRLHAALHHGPGALHWAVVAPSPALPGIREMVASPAAGQFFLTLRVGEQPATTIACVAAPNRCTLVVLTLDHRQPRIAQYLVPVGHLMMHLNPGIVQRINDRRQSGFGPLYDLRKLSLMHRAFRRRQDLAKECGQDVFEQLLHGKWVDPIGGALATYECVRRNQRHHLAEVAFNMNQYFADLPDTAAISRLVGQLAPPRGLPIFFDGLRVFKPAELPMPFNEGLLDFGSPWTSWRGAVA